MCINAWQARNRECQHLSVYNRTAMTLPIVQTKHRSLNEEEKKLSLSMQGCAVVQ